MRFILITLLILLTLPVVVCQNFNTSGPVGYETTNTQVSVCGDVQMQPITGTNQYIGPSYGTNVAGFGNRFTGESFGDPAFIFRANAYVFENLTPEWIMQLRDNGNVGIGIVSTQTNPLAQYKLDVQSAGVDDSTIFAHDTRIVSRFGSLNGDKGVLFAFSDSTQRGQIMCQGASCGLDLITHNGSAWIKPMEIDEAGRVKVNSLPAYSNNSAAVSGGLTAGSLYRTGGDPDLVAVVH